LVREKESMKEKVQKSRRKRICRVRGKNIIKKRGVQGSTIW